EFAARMAGEKYSAGGIATTVAATRAATDEELEANLVHLVDQATRQGTTTFEIKSGYGLTRDDEIRALEIIGRHTPESTLIAA
ncbi:imidazolonepropionase, partial [Vibrio cholerae O1]|nr:imidazolonepropionase [Vibrio cholerae O1]